MSTWHFPSHKTKVICTIGPACDSPDGLRELLRAGMNVARLNLAHGDHDSHGRTIGRLREAAAELHKPLTILADLPGPKLRVGKLDTDPMELRAGQTVLLGQRSSTTPTDESIFIPLPVPELIASLHRGQRVFLSDGFIELRVQELEGEAARCRVTQGGMLRSHGGVNVAGAVHGLSAITEQDQDHIHFCVAQGVDAMSVSFVQSGLDLDVARNLCLKLGRKLMIVAKVERAVALKDIAGILSAADVIMVARGDLGVETPIEEIALVQKRLIFRANMAGKPVITATQMLESMTEHNRPTRAEVTDVTNAILDGTDCVMLSGESAMGRYPDKAAAMLGRIATVTEHERRSYRAREALLEHAPKGSGVVEDLIAMSVWHAVERLHPKVVVVPTETGTTARRIAQFKLPCWIVAFSPHRHVCQELGFSYGVHAVQVPTEDIRPWQVIAREWLLAHGIEEGSLAIMTEGASRGHPGGTNRLEVFTI